jgi:radical SAM protein with 4Fe4S-binding SPASM domain
MKTFEPSREEEVEAHRQAGEVAALIRRGKIPVMLEDFQDPHKVFHHIDRVHELATTGDTRPVHMTIGLTNYCNHKCNWCYINWHQAGKLSERSGYEGEKVHKAINADWRLIDAVREAKEIGLKAVTIVGDGEPTMHPRFVEMFDALAQMGLDIGIFTNMSTRKPEVLEALVKHCFFLRCSIDAARPEVHAAMHGTDDFELVIANLVEVVKRRGSSSFPVIGVQYVTNHHNYADLPYAAQFYRGIGVDYMSIKPAYKNALNAAHEENELDINVALRYMREAKAFDTETFKVYAKTSQFLESLEFETNDARYYKKCLATPLSPYLDEDGKVEMCGNLKGRGFTVGNVYESSFQDIWNSERRKSCMSKIDLHKCPAGCKLDPLNKVLWDALNPEDERIHKNFV